MFLQHTFADDDSLASFQSNTLQKKEEGKRKLEKHKKRRGEERGVGGEGRYRR